MANDKEKVDVVLSQRMTKKLEELIRVFNEELGIEKDKWHRFSFNFKCGKDGQDYASEIKMIKQRHE